MLLFDLLLCQTKICLHLFLSFFCFCTLFFRNLEVALRKRAVNNQERNCLVLLFMPLTSRCPCPYFLDFFSIQKTRTKTQFLVFIPHKKYNFRRPISFCTAYKKMFGAQTVYPPLRFSGRAIVYKQYASNAKRLKPTWKTNFTRTLWPQTNCK